MSTDRRTKNQLLQEITELEAQIEELENGAAQANKANQAVMSVLKTENQQAKIMEAQNVASERVIQEYRWLARLFAGQEIPYQKNLKSLKDPEIKAD